MVLSIRGTLADALESLDYLEANDPPFSIRDWVQSPVQDSCLFIAASTSQRESLRPLMSAWLSIAVKSLMQQGSDLSRRVWFIIDELASLNKVPTLSLGLSESRKYGGCFALAFQDLNQLDSLYGATDAKTLCNLMGTKLVFRLKNTAAKQIAPLFGN